MGNLDGKVAIVTGAGRGIGQQIARKLAECGAKVAVVDLKAEWCEETVAIVKAAGSEAMALGCNVAVSAEVDACVKAVVAQFGTVDIMVNNAGITKDGLLMRMSDEDWDAVLNVNLKGTFLFTRAVARPMMKNKSPDGTQLGGAIINIASVVGIMGNAGQANYTASKGGVIALTKTTAKELGARVHPVEDDGRSSGRREEGVHGHDSAQALRHRRGHRQVRGVPRRSRRLVHHWPDNLRQRRNDRLTA